MKQSTTLALQARVLLALCAVQYVPRRFGKLGALEPFQSCSRAMEFVFAHLLRLPPQSLATCKVSHRVAHRALAASFAGSELRSQALNRIGNMLIPNSNYIAFEDWMMPLLDEMLQEQKDKGTVWTPSKVRFVAPALVTGHLSPQTLVSWHLYCMLLSQL